MPFNRSPAHTELLARDFQDTAERRVDAVSEAASLRRFIAGEDAAAVGIADSSRSTPLSALIDVDSVMVDDQFQWRTTCTASAPRTFPTPARRGTW